MMGVVNTTVSRHVRATLIAAGGGPRANFSTTVAPLVGLLAVLVVLWSAPAVAATITAASCSYSDVNSSVGAASAGDTVLVPAGNCTWTSGLAISKAITLRGAGIGQTFITDNYTGGSLILVTESTAGSVRIQGFDFLAGTGPLNANPDFFIKVTATANGRAVLVTANAFTVGGSANALGFGTNRGVIWNNAFVGTVGSNLCLNNAAALRHKPSGLSSSWTSPAAYGAADTDGEQNLYFETNTLTNVFEGIDIDDNGRTVIRYNTITNSGVVSHGVDTSAVGGRYAEVYNNTFVFDTTVVCAPDLPANVNSFIFVRGGTMLIHHNVVPRLMSQAWGSKSEISFIVEELRRNAGPYPCWGSTTAGSYPAPRQTGWGYSSGSTPAGTTGVFQDREPIYLWNNTGAGNFGSPAIGDYSPNQCGASAPSSAAYIQAGREYFAGTAKPGYTPFTYPHPLTGSSQAPPTGPSLPSPTNLQVR
jgi:hypothetical protein